MMQKSIVLLVTFFLTGFLSAQTPIHNFDELMAALKQGKQVNTVIYYGKCKLISDGVEQAESPDAIGGMKLDTYEYFDSSVFKGRIPSFISTSQTILINHPSYGYVYNYVKIKIRIDNTIEITARYLRPRKFSSRFKIVMDETFKSTINDGANDAGVVFFAH